MKPNKKFMRPAIKWAGGQSKACRWIVRHLVEHDVYCEPFAGGLNVLLNKPRCAVEWVGDTHASLMNLYGVLADRVLCERFVVALRSVRYRERTFRAARGLLPCGNPVRDALLFYIQHRMSRNGEGKSFSWTKSGRLRGGQHGDVNAWETMRGLVPEIGFRLRGVGLYCGRALDLMGRVAAQHPDAVYYLDPPWPHESRSGGSRLLYGEHEMSVRQHEELLEYIVGMPARAVYISTAPNELYAEVLGGAGWDCDRLITENNMATGKDKEKKVALLYWRS